MTLRLLIPLVWGALVLVPTRGSTQGVEPRLDRAWRLSFAADRAIQTGDLAAAERAVEEALGICAGLGRLSPYCLVPARQRAGKLLMARGEAALAEQVYRDVIRLADATYPPPSPWYAQLRLNLAVAIADQGRFREAEVVLREALPLAKAVSGPQPQLEIDILSHQGFALLRLGRAADAAATLRASVRAAEASGPGSPEGIGATRLNLADALRRLGQFDEAETLQRQIISERETDLGQGHAAVADALTGLALTLADRGQDDAAIAQQKRALDILHRAFSVPHRQISIGLLNLARLIERTGRLEEAGQVMAQSLTMFAMLGPGSRVDAANVSDGLAQLRQRQGRLAEAEDLARSAVAIREARQPVDAGGLAAALCTLGFILRDLGEFADAEDVARRAQDAIASLPETVEARARLLVLQSDLARLQRRPGQALMLLARAEAIFAARQTGPDSWTAQVLFSQGLALLDRGDAAAAEARLTAAIRLAPTAPAMVAHARSLLMLGRMSEATAELRQVARRYEAGGTDPLGPAEVLLDLAIIEDRQGHRASADARLEEAVAATQRPAATADPRALSGLLSRMVGHAIQTGRPVLAQDLAERGLHAASGEPSQRLLDAWNNRGHAAMAVRRIEPARASYETALAMARARYGPDHIQVAGVRLSLATLERIEGRFVAATEHALEALARFEGSGDDPGLAATLNTLGVLTIESGRYAEAEALLHRAEAVARAGAPAMRGSILANLSAVLRRQGRIDDAIRAAEQSLAAIEAVTGAGDGEGRAGTLNLLALAHAASATPWVAEPIFREVLAMRERMLPPRHPDVARALVNLGHASLAAGRGDEAEALVLRALDIAQGTLPAGHPELADALAGVADLRADQGRYAEAEYLLRRALEIRTATWGEDHQVTALTQAGLASIIFRRGDVDDARTLYRAALDTLQRTLPLGTPSVEQVKLELGTLEVRSGRTHQAQALLIAADAALRAAFGPAHPRLVGSLLALSELAGAQGDLQEALLLAQRALAIRETPGAAPAAPAMIVVLRAVGWACLRAGQPGEAVEALDRAAALLALSGISSAIVEAELLLAKAAAATQLKRFEEAEAELQRYVALIGVDWPAGQIAGLNSLAILRMVQDRGAEAAILLEDALRLLAQRGGSLLPTAGRLLLNLAVAYEASDRHAEAVLARERGVAMLLQAGWTSQPSTWL